MSLVHQYLRYQVPCVEVLLPFAVEEPRRGQEAFTDPFEAARLSALMVRRQLAQRITPIDGLLRSTVYQPEWPPSAHGDRQTTRPVPRRFSRLFSPSLP